MKRLWMRVRSASGLTLLEVTLMLTMTLAIVAALAPSVGAVVQSARTTRATDDMADLKTAILACISDIGFPEFKVDGDGKGGGDTVDLLVSDGDTPTACGASAVDGCGAGAKSWIRAVQPDSNGTSTFTFVDFMARHLIDDAPGNNTANAYVTAWKGAYVNGPIDSDPWGNRYALSAGNMNKSPQTADLLSAGPDEAIDTTWDLAATTAGKDDLVLFVK